MREELGASLLLVEGGPTINGELFEIGCVDEFFLTLGGVVVNGDRVKTAVHGDRAPSIDALTHLDLLSAVPNGATNELYLRYRVQR
jgi:riboflavin biosynthesis pyrimidine reductase